LTGLADRSHLLSPEVNLETHINDVVNLIRWEELSDVVLCGHSYGGSVVAGAADRIPERIGALVYLDAFVVENGQSIHDVLPAPMREAQIEGAKQTSEGWKVPPITAEAFHVNAGDCDWVNRQCTPQPLATFQQPLHLSGGIRRIDNIAFILANGWAPSPFQPFYERAQREGWKAVAMPTGHDVMIDQPAELAAQLVAVAPREAAAQ
jgi:pimeloyl-ACP methyl ester carboxylesterase